MRNLTRTMLMILFFAFLGGSVIAQTRVNDKDIEAMMKNLNQDAKKFTKSFNSGITKTSIRGTSREKESKQMVKVFEQQTADMLKNFKKNKKAEAEMQLVLRSADQIAQLLKEVQLDQLTVSNWQKLDEELNLLSKGLGIQRESAQP